MQAQDTPKKSEFIIHPILQQSIGFYSILLPPDYNDPAKKNIKYPLCVLIPGNGHIEEEYLDFVAQGPRRDGVIYLTPRAPYPNFNSFLKNKRPGYTADPEYDNDWSTITVSKDLQPGEVEVEKLYTGWITQCAEDARKHYRVTAGKIVAMGHSQGGAFSFRLAVDHPELIKACFLMEGYYDNRLKDDAAAKALKENQVHVLVTHNEDDQVVEFAQATALVAYLKKNGVSSEHAYYSHGKHDITEPCKVLAKEFIDKWCRGSTGAAH